MDTILRVLQVVAPIFTAIFLGMIAKKNGMLTRQEVQGFQQFVMKFALPCVVFQSCLTADMGMESLSSMAMVLPAIVISSLWAFRARNRMFPYHNLPMLFSAQETGMLGIPLVMILFGAEHTYRMGILDLTQAVIAYPVIAILTSDTGENPSVPELVKKVLSSPLLIMSLLGLALNLTGIGGWMESIGIRAVITECTGFLSQPISALMLFSVGFNFSLSAESRGPVFRITLIHFGMFAVFCTVMQLLLCLIPGVDVVTRWILLLYCALPASYLSPGLGRSEEDSMMASGVCSVLTVGCLLVVCIMAAILV
ncbi:MAG: AEC family transporter [Oscillospiraceae bacterium]|nr:AEC family transporter [Oscillospiraceae bacterium]